MIRAMAHRVITQSNLLIVTKMREGKELKQKALNYLKQNFLRNVGLIEIIQRGTSKIIETSESGVFMQDTVSEGLFLSCDSIEITKEWLKKHEHEYEYGLFEVCQEEIAKMIKDTYQLETIMECKQAVYTGKKIPYNYQLTFQEPDEQQMKIISANYHKITEKELKMIRNFHNLFVGMYENEMVGFIGSHLEGSVGLLEILPQYRKRGFGTELEIFMINYMLDKNRIPYGHVESWNEKSEGLQRKLGMDFADQMIYWIF